MNCNIDTGPLLNCLFMFLLGPCLTATGTSQNSTLDYSFDAKKIIEQRTVDLNQPWEFFWNQLLEPTESGIESLPLKVGRNWASLTTQNVKRTTGYGTYRLRIYNLAALEEGYSIAIRSASTALKLIAYPVNHPDKIRIATAGFVSKSSATSKPQLRPTSLQFFPNEDESEWIILVQVSNFEYLRGGLWTVPRFGIGRSAENQLQADREILLFCLGMIMVIGVYNIVLYARRPADRKTLMLALFCLVVCIRSIFTENLLSWYFPAQSTWFYHVKYFIEYATMIVGPLSCVTFIHLTFRDSSLPKLYKLVCRLSIVSVLIITFSGTYLRTKFLEFFQVVVFFQVIFGLSVLVRAMLHKREEAILSSIGGFILGSCVIYDILITLSVFPEPYVTSIGMSIFVFMQSQVVANSFAKAFTTAEHLSLRLKEEVESQTMEIRSIMENIPQGVFLMQRDQKIQGNYSKELERIVGFNDLTGKDALPILFERTHTTVDDQSIVNTILLTSFDEPLFSWDVNSHQLPKEIIKRIDDKDEQIFEIDWHPIKSKTDTLEKLLVTLRNVTEIRDLQIAQRRDQQAFSLLLEVIQVNSDKFRDFINQSKEFLDSIQSFADMFAVDHESRRRILMTLHTWKGLSRSLGFRTLTTILHESEQALSQERKNHASTEKELRQEIRKLEVQLGSYQGVEKQWLNRSQSEQVKSQSNALSKNLIDAWCRYYYSPSSSFQRELLSSISIYVSSLPSTKISHIAEKLLTELSSLASELHKPEPKLDIIDSESLPLASHLFRNILYALQHLIRNSMDHGFESEEDRVRLEKNPYGTISVRFYATKERFCMDYWDDGQGIDLIKVLKKAKERNLLASSNTKNAKDIAMLIFAPGFSTKDSVSTISGRGIGMDAVRLLVEEMGGDLDLILEGDEVRAQKFTLNVQWPLDELSKRI